jgi:lantibiotic modifying enzyme
VNTGRKDRKTALEVKEPSSVQYSKFMKSIDKADHYFNYYPILSKTVK